MLICQNGAEFTQPDNDEQCVDWSLWSLASKQYPNLGEMPSFVAQQQQQHVVKPVAATANPNQLKELLLHFSDKQPENQCSILRLSTVSVPDEQELISKF